MSKEIFLYSEDKKYKCAVELSDSLDQFKCPDHSVLILFEERENGTYIIAQSRDKRLETEKDQKIADLEAKLAEKEREIEKYKELCTISKLEDLQVENMLLKGKNQDKISFCIEQLEKVKELIKNMSVGIGIEIYGTRIKPVEEYIENQIKAIKEKSND